MDACHSSDKQSWGYHRPSHCPRIKAIVEIFFRIEAPRIRQINIYLEIEKVKGPFSQRHYQLDSLRARSSTIIRIIDWSQIRENDFAAQQRSLPAQPGKNGRSLSIRLANYSPPSPNHLDFTGTISQSRPNSGARIIESNSPRSARPGNPINFEQ